MRLSYHASMVKEVKIGGGWKEKLSDEFEKLYFKELTDFVRGEYQKANIYLEPKNIFRAFDLTSFDDVKVVILLSPQERQSQRKKQRTAWRKPTKRLPISPGNFELRGSVTSNQPLGGLFRVQFLHE